jgi:Ca2+/Na+ antiporter
MINLNFSDFLTTKQLKYCRGFSYKLVQVTRTTWAIVIVLCVLSFLVAFLYYQLISLILLASVLILLAFYSIFLLPTYRAEFEAEIDRQYKHNIDALLKQWIQKHRNDVMTDISRIQKEIEVTEKSVRKCELEQARHRAKIQEFYENIHIEKRKQERQITQYLEEDIDLIQNLGARKAGITTFDKNSRSLSSIHQANTRFARKGFIYESSARTRFIKIMRNGEEERQELELLVDSSIKKKARMSNGVEVHGVYEFIVIFWLEGSLVVYIGFWDFSRGTAVDERVTTYPYDVIVSVEVFQRTSTRLKDENSKRLYKDEMTINLVDGRTLIITDSEVNKQSDVRAKFDNTNDTDLSEAGRSLKSALRRYRNIQHRE